MMRFANGSLSAPEIRQILVDTGWNGSGRVSKGLDAFAAVFAAIHRTLPDIEEPNNTPASARDLLATGSAGALAPGFGGFTSRSSSTDPDYWKFRVKGFSIVTVAVDWYERLSSLFVAVESEDLEVRGPEEMTQSGSSQSGRFVLTGLLPPGIYRIRVGGTGITAYRLLVTRQSAPLPTDMFENNDSFTQAARLLFKATKWTDFGLRTWGPGTYDATLHRGRGAPIITSGVGGSVMNDDYFRLEVPSSSVFSRPTVRISDADEQLDITLHDEAHAVIQTWTGVRNMTAHPPDNTTCFLKISGNAPTSYRITTRMETDPRSFPGPLQEELELLPKWWGDPPPLHIKDIVTHYVVEVNENRGDGETIAFQRPEEAVRLELLNHSGEVMREADAVNDQLFIDIRGIQRGSYVLRVSKNDHATRSVVQLRLVPPLQLSR